MMNEKLIKIELFLTKAEKEKLFEALDHWDEGPYGEGWQSKTMIKVKEKVYKACGEKYF